MVDNTKPCTLKIYFKSGNVATIPNVTDWEAEGTGQGVKKLNMKFKKMPGVELPIGKTLDITQIEFITEIYPE